MIESYPLHWPAGYKRHSGNRYSSKFKQTMDQAQRFLRMEISRLGGKELIVSTNLPLRNDGQLYADWMRKKIDDPGVAIYFKWKGKDVAMCCDQYPSVWENIYALGKGIEALRGMDRWGVSDFLDRVFTGFKALPETTGGVSLSWWNILNVSPDANEVQIKAAYRALANKYHPDNIETGNAEKFIQIKAAYDQALQK